MSLDVIPRRTWGALPPEKPLTPWNPANLWGGAQHWFGIPDGNLDHSKCDDVMRGVQKSHQQGEFVDIAYNHCICPHGKIYEARGFTMQTGANGTTEANRHYYAVCVMMGIGNAPAMFSPVVQTAVRALRAEWLRRGSGTAFQRHGFFTGSACPGPTISAWVQAGKYKVIPSPTNPPTPTEPDMIPDWLDDWLYWKFVNQSDPAKRPTTVPDFANLTPKQREEAWEFATIIHRLLTHAGPQESFLEWAEWRLVEDQNPATRPQVPVTIPSPWWPSLEKVHEISKAYCAK